MTVIVVVNWNSGSLLGGCLRSLAEFAPGCRTVVVDNASDDDSWLPAADSDRVTLLRNPGNDGFAAACNRGWRSTGGDPVLFLNPDAEATAGAIETLAAAIEARGETWAAAGLLVGATGEPQHGFNVRRFPTVASVAADALLLEELWPGNPWTRRLRMADFGLDRERDVDQPAAACLMVRRRVLEQLDGFDEAFRPAWFEDVDLCRRIHDRGGRIRFVHRARFLHRGGASLRRIPYAEFLWHFNRNRLRYFEKHHGPAAASKVRRLLVAGLRLRSLGARLGIAPPGLPRDQAARVFGEAARLLTTEKP